MIGDNSDEFKKNKVLIHSLKRNLYKSLMKKNENQQEEEINYF